MTYRSAVVAGALSLAAQDALAQAPNLEPLISKTVRENSCNDTLFRRTVIMAPLFNELPYEYALAVCYHPKRTVRANGSAGTLNVYDLLILSPEKMIELDRHEMGASSEVDLGITLQVSDKPDDPRYPLNANPRKISAEIGKMGVSSSAAIIVTGNGTSHRYRMVDREWKRLLVD
jgi:hypothetical protein